MRRLVTLLTATALGLSTLSHADSSDCIKALDDADGLISKQEQLIQKLSKVVAIKQNQDDELSKTLVRMKELSDEQLDINIASGAVGVVVGVLAVSLLRK